MGLTMSKKVLFLLFEEGKEDNPVLSILNVSDYFCRTNEDQFSRLLLWIKANVVVKVLN